jgi:hypothetical protein
LEICAAERREDHPQAALVGQPEADGGRLHAGHVTKAFEARAEKLADPAACRVLRVCQGNPRRDDVPAIEAGR